MKSIIIDRQCIRHNIEQVKLRAQNAAIYGVLKGDGYGLGLLELASLLREGGVARFAVTEADDALRLRANGFTQEEILLLRPAEPRSLEAILENGITASIGSREAAEALGALAARRSVTARVHIEIDTGMGRYGFLPGEIDPIEAVFRTPGLEVAGIYTHFSSAFGDGKATRAQFARFTALVERLRAGGLEPGLVHAANSSALMRFGMNLDAVRVGSALTGRLAGEGGARLQKAGYIRCEVDEVRWLPKGSNIGYGDVFKTRRPTKIAVLPVGYAHGFGVEKARDAYRLRDALRYIFADLLLALGRNRLYAMVNGKRAPVLGRVGMLHTTVDVTGIECAPGDPARLEASPFYCGLLEREYVN